MNQPKKRNKEARRKNSADEARIKGYKGVVDTGTCVRKKPRKEDERPHGKGINVFTGFKPPEFWT